MAEPQFEIAFSGQIAEGADLETVKQNISKLFKADAERLEQMFSGKRVLIKRAADEAIAAKYRGAFQKAGAICEIRQLEDTSETAGAAAAASASAAAATTASEASPAVAAEDYVSRYPESEVVPQALLTEPLGVSAEAIGDLGADIAPVGSAMQDSYEEAAEPAIDISGLDVAPVGSQLVTSQEEAPPPPPDTSGITLADS